MAASSGSSHNASSDRQFFALPLNLPAADTTGAGRPTTRRVLARHQRYLVLCSKKKCSEALSGRSQHVQLVPVKVFLRGVI